MGNKTARLAKLEAIHGTRRCRCQDLRQLYVSVTREEAERLEATWAADPASRQERCERCDRPVYRIYTTIDIDRV